MSILALVVIIFFIIVIILLAIIFFGVFTRSEPIPLNIEELIHLGEEKGNWQTPAQPVPNNARSVCSIYSYPLNTIPSLDPQVVNNLTPINFSQAGCLDSDQLALQYVVRTCGRADNTAKTCIGYDGTIFKEGQKELIYQTCGVVAKCQKTVFASIAFNFNPDTFPESRCLEYTPNSTDIKVVTCDATDIKLFFRTTRAEPVSGSDNNYKLNEQGPYVQIFERNSGQCLEPEAIGPGQQLQLAECSPNDGFNWFLVPPIKITYNKKDIVTPQMIIYMKNIIVPPSPDELVDFVDKNKPLAIFPYTNLPASPGDQPTGDIPTLQLLTEILDQPVAIRNTLNSQIIDQRIYQIMAEGGPRVTSDPPDITLNFPYYVYY